MSYADAAASGPSQSREAAYVPTRAPPIPEIQDSTLTENSSLIDVDSPHVTSVSSEFESQSVRTSTQAERLEREAEEATRREAARAKAAAKDGAGKLRKNADNPVLLGNGIVIGTLVTVLGIGAYRKYQQDGFSWRLAGIWGGVVGAFAIGDYFVSRWLLQKYPPKK